MSSTFDGSKVSGLANAVDEQIENVQSDINTFISDACVQFLTNDENYNIKKQIEVAEHELSYSYADTADTVYYSNDYVVASIMVSIPTCEYDTQSGSWSIERSYTNMEFMTVLYCPESEETLSISGLATFTFGQYACEMFLTAVFEGTSNIYHFTCSEPVWRKVSFT